MSKLGCICGHTIRDQSDSLPYKGSVLADVDHTAFFDWVLQETQSYITAVQGGGVEQWLLKTGYTPEYVALNLSHGDILHDHIRARYLDVKRDMYECEACGRIKVERRMDNVFASYTPDNGAVNAVLAGVAPAS